MVGAGTQFGATDARRARTYANEEHTTVPHVAVVSHQCRYSPSAGSADTKCGFTITNFAEVVGYQAMRRVAQIRTRRVPPLPRNAASSACSSNYSVEAK